MFFSHPSEADNAPIAAQTAGSASDSDAADPFTVVGALGKDWLGRLSGGERPEWTRRLYYGFAMREDLKPVTYIETIQPLYQDTEQNRTVFLQPRINYDGTDQDFYNLGAGIRDYLPAMNALVGVNVFGDYQRDPGHGRVGVGAELLGDHYDVRVNGYFKMSPRRRVEETLTQLIYEEAVNGLDAEAGTALPYLPHLKVFGGGKFYDFKHGDNLRGWTSRLELKPVSYLTVDIKYSDDNKINGEWQVDVRLSFDFEDIARIGSGRFRAPEAWPQGDARRRSLDRVQRESRIIKERFGVDKNTGISFEIGRSA